MNTPLLEIDNLVVSFSTLHGDVEVLDGISFGISEGEIVGLVGESGSGKSVTAFSTIRLLGSQGHINDGKIVFDGDDLVAKSEIAMTKIRGRDISMIFQEPMTSLNPVFTIGLQISEVLSEHLGLARSEAREQAINLLAKVGIPAPEERINDYPHQLSGGMRQRVMIAIALACQPRLLIADEPTTALDVTVQAQILDLLRKLRQDNAMAILLITHDFGIIADITDRVVVMYAGQIVEQAPVEALFEAPLHPYSRLLMESIPTVTARRDVLPVIDGVAPVATAYPSGCRFHVRCPKMQEKCRDEMPALEEVSSQRSVRCWFPEGV
ncbi:MAG: ABC transporter ATP-binding protein [Rhizobiaceae bacterium]